MSASQVVIRYVCPVAIGVVSGIIDGHGLGKTFWFGMACWVVPTLWMRP